MCNHYEFDESKGIETKECLSCKHANATPAEEGSVNIHCSHAPEYYKDHPYD